MNPAVLMFFVLTVIATVLLGGKFARRADPVLKYFGVGLLLEAVAFALWTVGYLAPEVLLICVTYGAIAFLVSLVVFLYASLQHAPRSARRLVTVLGGLIVVMIFLVGRYGDANLAYISPEGFLFFNLSPFVQMLYTFALALAAFPVIDLVAFKFKGCYAALLRYGLIAEIVGGVMLITNKDATTLYITGWIIGIVYLVLWVTLLFSRKAWSGVR